MASMLAETLVIPVSTSHSTMGGSDPACPQMEISTPYSLQTWMASWIRESTAGCMGLYIPATFSLLRSMARVY